MALLTEKNWLMEQALPLTLSLAPSRFPVGSRLRSYDFPDRTDCYVEGILVDYEPWQGCMRYLIAVSSVVWDGKADPDIRDPNTYIVRPPMNGTPNAWRGHTSGVSLVAMPRADRA